MCRWLNLAATGMASNDWTVLTSLALLTRLDLHGNQFWGTIPSALSRLTALSILDLSANLLSGTVPSTLSTLCSASKINFSGNQLTGTVPASLTGVFPVNSSIWSSNCMVNTTTSVAGCDMNERPALIDLYVSTAGPGWTVNTGWLTTSHPCTWFGVTCYGGSTTTGPVVYVLCAGACYSLLPLALLAALSVCCLDVTSVYQGVESGCEQPDGLAASVCEPADGAVVRASHVCVGQRSNRVVTLIVRALFRVRYLNTSNSNFTATTIPDSLFNVTSLVYVCEHG